MKFGSQACEGEASADKRTKKQANLTCKETSLV